MKNEYKKLKQIGEGAFSTVWLAADSSGKDVVLKEYHSNSGKEARREYLFLQALSSDYIVKALEFQSEPPMLVQEYVKGTTWQPTLLKTRKQKDLFLARLAATLSQLHSAGICYNDLKPDNIILREGEPVLIDLGLAVPNRFADDIFRGTPAYAAPEKINYHINSLAADVFAFGLIATQTLYNILPADTMEFAEYKKLLRAPTEWQKYLQANVTDKMLQSSLSLAPDQRPALAQLSVYFAGKAGISLSETKSDIIKQYVFQCQQAAVQKLLLEKKIICAENDEPEKIIEQVILWLEAAGNETLLLKESDLIWQPQSFYQQMKKQVASESELLELLKTCKSRLLIFRDLPRAHTKLFDQLSQLPEVLLITKSSRSSLGNATYSELQNLSKNFDLKIISLPSDFAAKPALTRLQLLKENGVVLKGNAPQKIIDLMSAIQHPLPVLLLENIWPQASNHLPALVSHPAIRLKNDGLYFVGDATGKLPSNSLLEKVTKYSEDLGFFSIAAKAALLLKQDSRALSLIEEYLNSLISQEFYTSAYEVLQLFSAEVSLSLSLQKRQAFLLRKNGYLQEALEKYEELKAEADSLEFATIASDRAVILQELNRLEEALKIHQQVLPVFQKLENKKSVLRTLNNIGVIQVQSNNFIQAEQTFLQMLEMAEKAADKQFITMAHLNLADVYLRRGEWKKSLYQAQTAAELGRKFNRKTIEIWAQIYGIQARWALGSVVNLDQVILQILTDEKLQEQAQLLENFAVNLLPVMLNLQPQKSESLFSILNSSQTASEEKNQALFWYFIYKNNFFNAFEVMQKVEERTAKHLAKAYLAGNSTLLASLFRELGLRNDCFGYLKTALLVCQNQHFRTAENLRTEISSFSSLHPFHPLTTIKEKIENEPQMQHLEVLWEIVSLIHSNESFDTTMHSILAGIIRIVGLERAVYYTFVNGEMKPKLGLNRDFNPLDLADIRISKTILQETIKLGHIRFFESLQEETPFDIHSSIFGLGLRTAVCYPIIVNNEIRGVIYADATAAKEFSEQEQNLLEALFVQSRAALEKTEKIETLLKERQQILASAESSYPEIIGNSQPMQKIFTLMKTVGSHNVNILITGPTGSGKELIAKALHREYNATAPFIAVNCAAIPENLLESELFGYSKGAFTGAVKDTIGKIEAANGGTLFLDEIGDMPAALQAKLLRVLQDRLITPLGTTKDIPVSFRIITATNKNLKELVKQNVFREDLYFRLNVVEINLPSLAERKDDILPLAEFFMQKFNEKFGKHLKQINSQSARTLLQKAWRGNVRELENTMEKAVLLSPGEELDTQALDLQTDELSLASHEQLPVEWEKYRTYRKRIIHQLDKRYTDQLLEKTNGNINQASTLGKIPRPQIYRILKDL